VTHETIGQVYRGRLRADGAEVAVKVQRPGLRAVLSLDVFILRKVAIRVRSLLC
jgi:aarF domain-containing kinase